MAILKTNNLMKKYKDFLALDDVSITVDEGDVYGLIGRNGAGKTTLFKLIMGLTKPTAGTLSIGAYKPLRQGRKTIGFMIGPAFFSYLNPYENIEYYRKLKGIKSKSETNRVLNLVGLHDVKKPFKSFSMGMKQRLGIANALLGKPDIVILDEPINGLDPQGITDIRNMIKRINQELGTTFIISSHILSELDLVATKFGFIEKGQLLQEISHGNLHKQVSTSLIIEIDHVKKAVDVLMCELNISTHHIEVDADGQIRLQTHLNQSNEVSKILVENGISLYTIKKEETTLEQYFMGLVGGVGHA